MKAHDIKLEIARLEREAIRCHTRANKLMGKGEGLLEKAKQYREMLKEREKAKEEKK